MTTWQSNVGLLLIVGFIVIHTVTTVTAVGRRTLECYACDSSENEECATKPGQQLNVEECVNVDDECVTSITAGITRRGCLKRLYPNKYCAAPCDRCNTSLCNRNVYPEDRLHCYQCVGANCIDVANKTNSLAMPCPIYHEADRCYTNVISINNVHRGCVNTNLPAPCQHVCLKCNYNNCNNELGVWQDSCLECVHTPTSPNPLCLRQQTIIADGTCSIGDGLKRCSNRLIYGHHGKCYTYINEQTGVVQRGCSSTKGFFPTGNLTECTGNNCNKECLPIACNNCSTKNADANCRSGVNLRSQKCDVGTFACYSCEAGAQLRRGCMNAVFQPAHSEACYSCTSGDGCNRLPARTCYHCNSLENSACSNWSNESRIQRKICDSATELCVSTVLSKLGMTYTVRGCASHITECTPNDPLCVRCNGSLCNNQPTSWTKLTSVHLSHGTAVLRNGQGSSKIKDCFSINLSLLLGLFCVTLLN